MKPIKIFVIVLSACFIACVIILAYLLGGSDEILCPASHDIHCICDVSVDCCCPTETVTPSETSLSSATYTQSVETIIPTATSTSIQNHTPVWPTPTITDAPTPTPHDVPSRTPKPTYIPTATVEVCYQWICHRTGSAGWINYCCDSIGCVDAKIKQGDLLGRCEDHGIVPHEDE